MLYILKSLSVSGNFNKYLPLILLPVDDSSKPHIQPSEHGVSPHRFQQVF